MKTLLGSHSETSMISSLVRATGVAGILRIPGRSWSGTPMTPASLGPWGYLVMQGLSAILIDVLYYSTGLVDEVHKLAPRGITHIFLTHDDFVRMSSHASWKLAFPKVTRVAYCTDCARCSIEIELSDSGPWDIAGFRIDRVPGHSEGPVFYASPELSAVFTGDSIGFWGNQPTGFGSHCQFGSATQAKSLRRYAHAAPFCKALLPGHGLPAFFEDEQQRMFFLMLQPGALMVAGTVRRCPIFICTAFPPSAAFAQLSAAKGLCQNAWTTLNVGKVSGTCQSLKGNCPHTSGFFAALWS